MTKKSLFLLPLTALTFLSLTACETAYPVRYQNPQIVADSDRVSLMLAQAADRSSQALETLAAIEQTRTPTVNLAPPSNVPPELQRAVSVNWMGPVENITKQMAARAGYKFTVLGRAPANDVVVTLKETNTPLIDVFRGLGLQLGQIADIRVDAARQVIELSYTQVVNTL